MSEFNFKSQICTDKNQSERLLALGLKKETADMALFEYIDFDVENNCNYKTGEYEAITAKYAKNIIFENSDLIPAWSLHRLIELIWGEGEHDMSLETHRPFEDCIERIDYMINQSCCFNKEYLV